MAKYKVVTTVMWHDGKRCVRGDIIESDIDLGTRAELVNEEEQVVQEKPKRKRRTKVVLEGL